MEDAEDAGEEEGAARAQGILEDETGDMHPGINSRESVMTWEAISLILAFQTRQSYSP